MPKYHHLAAYLAQTGAATIHLTFAEIEAIVGGLPRSARLSAYWWGVPAGRSVREPHVYHWRQAGYVTARVDLVGEQVTFESLVAQPRVPENLCITFQYQQIFLWRGTRAFLGDPTHVAWLYDEGTRRIGLRASPGGDDAYRVTLGHTVATTSFFRRHGIVVPLGAISQGEPVGDVLMFGLPHGPDAAWRLA